MQLAQLYNQNIDFGLESNLELPLGLIRKILMPDAGSCIVLKNWQSFSPLYNTGSMTWNTKFGIRKDQPKQVGILTFREI